MTLRRSVSFACGILCMTVMELHAQPTAVVSGLVRPIKLLPHESGVILVAEGGAGPNTGRVSLVSTDGGRGSLIDGLPSGPSPPNSEPDGVTGLALRNRTLFIAIGEGNSAISGPAPGTAVPNPGTYSPILSSILALDFDRDVSLVTGGFTLPPSDHATLAGGGAVMLTNRDGQTARLRLVVDIPDFQVEPRPGVPNNVRLSHPFGLEIADSCGLWLADAGRNTLGYVDTCRSTYFVVVSFPQYRNPLPTGAPMIDAVPTSVRSYAGDLLMTMLSGSPFPPGVAEVLRVKPPSGSSEPFFAGLHMLIDVLPYAGAPDGFFVLEFAAGRVLWFDSPSASPSVFATGLVTPTNMAIDPRTGNLVVSEINTGRIVSVPIPR